jgi:uncharacterized membrane protein YvbJ
MEDNCVLCGVIVPEGRMICPHCENDLTEAEARYERILQERIQETSARPKWSFLRKKYGRKTDRK